MGIKINPNDLREIPKDKGDFGFCVYGDLTNVSNSAKFMTIIQWMNYWGFRAQKSGPYTNILIPKSFDLSECFYKREPHKYMDGFSPNLNKYLHLGHFSNLIIAKTFKFMGIAEQTVAILGDTLPEKDVLQVDAIRTYKSYCKMFGYDIDHLHFASAVKLDKETEEKLLKEGEGEYEGTKFFEIDGEKKVAIKSDGTTSYLYQDVAFAYLLKSKTLYLTGLEQKSHFDLVSKIVPSKIKHIGLGLVTVNGKKMSSREGNVLYMKDIISDLNKKFGNMNLTYNVIAGQILKSEPSKMKSIDMDTIDNVKGSPGLYLSYTAARLKSAGVTFENNSKFHSNYLQYKFLKSSWNYSPKTFLDALIEHCKEINKLYENPEYNIQKDDNVRIFFGSLLEDLELGMKKLGLFSIEEVKNQSINELNEQKL
jgi:arginyl-tRNA synthetase